MIEPLQPAIDILQEELGETNPPITARFFLWFCFYPASLEFESNDEDKLYFKDPVKNLEPTRESVQPALDRLDKSQSLMKVVGESNNVKIVEEMMKNLKSQIVELLDEEMLNVILLLKENILYFWLPNSHLIPVVNNLTMKSTDLPLTSYTNCDKVAKQINFRIKRGQVMKANVIMELSVRPAFQVITLEFSDLPGSMITTIEIQFSVREVIDVMKTSLSSDLLRHSTLRRKLSKLHPVTELLNTCIDKHDQDVFEITDHFTAVFFISRVRETMGILHNTF